MLAAGHENCRHEIRQHLFNLPGVLKVTVGFIDNYMHVAVYGGDMIHVAKTVQDLKPEGMALNLDFMERSAGAAGRFGKNAVTSGQAKAAARAEISRPTEKEGHS